MTFTRSSGKKNKFEERTFKMKNTKKAMIYPAIAELMEKVDSKYTLVIMTAKRARQITAGSIPRTDFESKKSTSIAVNEIFEDKVTYSRTKDGIK